MKSKRFMYDKPQKGISEQFLKLVFYCIYEYENVYLDYIKEQQEKEEELTFAQFALENLMNIQEAMTPLLFSMVFNINYSDDGSPIDKLSMANYIKKAMDIIKEEAKKQHEEV